MKFLIKRLGFISNLINIPPLSLSPVFGTKKRHKIGLQPHIVVSDSLYDTYVGQIRKMHLISNYLIRAGSKDGSDHIILRFIIIKMSLCKILVIFNL